MLEGRHVLPDLVEPEAFIRGSSDDDDDLPRVGQNSQYVLEGRREVVRDRNDGVVVTKPRGVDPSLLDRRDDHGGIRKQSGSSSLHKSSSRRAHADDEIGRMPGAQRQQIIDERKLRILVAPSSDQKRMVLDVQRPGRLPRKLGTNGPGILAPGPEILSEGMQDHDAFQLGRRGLRRPARTAGHNQEKNAEAQRSPMPLYPHGRLAALHCPYPATDHTRIAARFSSRGN
ncbi:MAG: hypothetical protein ABW175_15275 [Bradyrhizobium sp.]